jgi:hypothetical protein
MRNSRSRHHYARALRAVLATVSSGRPRDQHSVKVDLDAAAHRGLESGMRAVHPGVEMADVYALAAQAAAVKVLHRRAAVDPDGYMSQDDPLCGVGAQ